MALDQSGIECNICLVIDIQIQHVFRKLASQMSYNGSDPVHLYHKSLKSTGFDLYPYSGEQSTVRSRTI